MEGQETISAEVLASYAADAARDVQGVRALVDSPLPMRKSVRIATDEAFVRVELHLCIEWGASIAEVGRNVQARVREYLERMANVRGAHVDVVVDEVGPLP
jgi:uncharacterized alkaline shock family protein YloU